MDDTMRIMVVEDNPHARQALKALLSLQAGVHVTEVASNGLEAIKIIKNQIPDLVLMDIRMPVMDGLEATKIIKQNWPQVKVIVLTIYSDRQKEMLSAGADAFLIKGCPINEVMSSIHELLDVR